MIGTLGTGFPSYAVLIQEFLSCNSDVFCGDYRTSLPGLQSKPASSGSKPILNSYPMTRLLTILVHNAIYASTFSPKKLHRITVSGLKLHAFTYAFAICADILSVFNGFVYVPLKQGILSQNTVQHTAIVNKMCSIYKN